MIEQGTSVLRHVIIHDNALRVIPPKLVLETRGGRVRWARRSQAVYLYLHRNEFRTREEARRGRPNAKRGK